MKPATIHALATLGFSLPDILALGRHARAMHRWDELLCGTAQGHVERDETTGACVFVSATCRYVDPHDPRARKSVPDRGANAWRKAQSIMARYPSMVAYHQTDPRGASLWIVPKSAMRPDVKGEPMRALETVYTMGTAVL